MGLHNTEKIPIRTKATVQLTRNNTGKRDQDSNTSNQTYSIC